MTDPESVTAGPAAATSGGLNGAAAAKRPRVFFDICKTPAPFNEIGDGY